MKKPKVRSSLLHSTFPKSKAESRERNKVAFNNVEVDGYQLDTESSAGHTKLLTEHTVPPIWHTTTNWEQNTSNWVYSTTDWSHGIIDWAHVLLTHQIVALRLDVTCILLRISLVLDVKTVLHPSKNTGRKN